MAHPLRRSWQHRTVGQIMFTVALDPEGEALTIERHRRLSDMSKWLVELFSAHRLPATWASGNPAQCAAARPVMRSAVPHEMALLSDEAWSGTESERTRFARELTRRLGLARSAGLSITSLVSRRGSVRSFADAAIRQGITAVVGADGQRNRRQSTHPRALRYGVWDLPVTERLPLRNSWLPGRASRFLRRVRISADHANMVHVLISVQCLEGAPPRLEAMISQVVRGVTELRDRGLVRTETLSSAVAKLSDVPTAVPQRSILRQAA